MSSDIELRNQNESQLQLLKQTIAKDCTDEELDFFLAVARSKGLDPLTGQISPVKRYDSSVGAETMTIQTGIDGFRVIAESTGKYEGQTEGEWCGANGLWVNVWLADEPPAAARVGVYRKDFKAPLYRVARYSSYVQRTKGGQPNYFWKKMPDIMLLKCAEAAALRAAFPKSLSGLYTPDEMGQAYNPTIEAEVVETPAPNLEIANAVTSLANHCAAEGIPISDIRAGIGIPKQPPRDYTQEQYKALAQAVEQYKVAFEESNQGPEAEEG